MGGRSRASPNGASPLDGDGAILSTIHSTAGAATGPSFPAQYPNLKTLDSICQISPDRLVEHSKALQTFRERWALLRKEYAARLECTNTVEDALRNMSLADMSYGAELVKSMVASFRDELTQVSMAQKDVLNLDDQMNAAEKAIENIIQIRSGVCR